MTAEQQQRMDAFYASDNVVRIDIQMPPPMWDAVRKEAPKGGVCNFDYRTGGRYTWRTAPRVTISGSKFPAPVTFTDVGVKKKSFCGSIRSDKPSLHLDFAKVNKDNKAAIDALIGTRYVTLNNSVQDPSFVRQVLGYTLFGLAGLPASRINVAQVRVNGVPIGQGTAAPGPGVYLNVEPFMPRYVERNFTHRKGNLYEIEHTDDFTAARLDFIGVEGLSEFSDKADLRFAIGQLKNHRIDGAAKVFDLDAFVRLYAMEFLTKHWDGYSRNTNNTYVYNDVDAVAAPGLGNVRFVLAPWGLDQILQPTRHFVMGTDGVLARLVRNDPARRAQLADSVRILRETVFGRDVQQSVLIPMLSALQQRLSALGVPNLPAEVDVVRKQLRLAASAGYLYAGLDNASGLYIRDDATTDVMHAGTETIPPGGAGAVNFETTHRPRPVPADDTDLWTFEPRGSGTAVRNKATGRVLHASATVRTSSGALMLYTCPGEADVPAERFTVVPVDSADKFSFSGYFELVSTSTGQKATFGTSPTPNGHPRVHQAAAGSRLYFS